MVGGYAFVFAGVAGAAVDDLESNDTVSMAHGIVVLGEFLSSLVPLDSGDGLAGETAEELARLMALDHTRTQQEGEARRALALLLPQLVWQRLATADDLFLWPVGRDLRGHRCRAYSKVSMVTVMFHTPCVNALQVELIFKV